MRLCGENRLRAAATPKRRWNWEQRGVPADVVLSILLDRMEAQPVGEQTERLPAIREHVKRAEALADEAERQAEEWRAFARELLALTEGVSTDTTAERRFRRRQGVGRKHEGVP